MRHLHRHPRGSPLRLTSLPRDVQSLINEKYAGPGVKPKLRAPPRGRRRSGRQRVFCALAFVVVVFFLTGCFVPHFPRGGCIELAFGSPSLPCFGRLVGVSFVREHCGSAISIGRFTLWMSAFFPAPEDNGGFSPFCRLVWFLLLFSFLDSRSSCC